MINDANKEFLSRVTSPVFGSALLSWAVCHWKILVVLTFGSEHPRTSRIDFVVKHFVHTHWYLNFWHFLLLPLILGAFVAWARYKINLLFYIYVEDPAVRSRIATELTREADLEEIKVHRKHLREVISGYSGAVNEIMKHINVAESSIGSLSHSSSNERDQAKQNLIKSLKTAREKVSDLNNTYKKHFPPGNYTTPDLPIENWKSFLKKSFFFKKRF